MKTAKKSAKRTGDFLEAGVSEKNITPKLPIEMAGMGPGNFANGVESGIFMRAFTFRKGREGFTILTCDVLGVDGAIKDEIRAAASSALRGVFSRHELFVACSHTHWAPTLRTIWGFAKVDSAYKRFFVESAVSAVAESVADLEKARLFAGRTECRLNINRRVVIDGRAFMLPEYPELMFKADGPVDREVGFVLVRRGDGANKGLIFNYSCHPISFPVKFDKISSDYPGRVVSMLREKYSMPVGFINAGAGDIAPVGSLRGTNTRDNLGEKIAENIMEVLDAGKLAEIGGGPFGSETFPVDFDIRQETMRRWPKSPYAAAKSARMPLGIFRIGEWGCCCLGGELFAAPCLDLKRKLPFRHSFVASYTNGYMGYLPYAGSYPEKGYEISAALAAEGSVELFVSTLLRKSDL